MAILGGQQDDDPNNPAKQGGAPAPGGQGGGESGYISGGTGTGATTKAAPAPTSSGGYTNLTSYLKANQNSGATTGKAAQNVVDESGRTADASTKAYGSAGWGEIVSGSTGLGTDSMSLGKIEAGGAKKNPGTAATLAAIKGGIASTDPSVLAQIKAGGTGTTYTGPTSIDTAYKGPTSAKAADYSGPEASEYYVTYRGPSDTQHFTGDAAAAQKKAVGDNDLVYGAAKNAEGGHSGVSALLRSAYQQPSYTAGENNLDAFLAGGTEGGKAELAKASGVAGKTATNYQALNDRLTGQIRTAQDKAAEVNKTYDDAVAAAKAQTDEVQRQYDAAIVDASSDSSASKAYADAIAAAQGQAAANKAAADAAAPEPTIGDASTSATNEPGTPKNPNRMSPNDVLDTIKKGSIASAKQDSKPAPINAQLPDAYNAAKPYIAPQSISETLGAPSAFSELSKRVGVSVPKPKIKRPKFI